MPQKKVLLTRLDKKDSREHPESIDFPYTLKYLQALLLRQNYNVQFLDCQSTHCSSGTLVDQALNWQPDVTVISSTPLERTQLHTVASKIKQVCGSYTIAVGQDVSLDPAYYANGSSPVDLAVPGEAERVCFETIERLRDPSSLEVLRTTFRGMLEKGEQILVDRLDELPLPNYTPGELDRYPHTYPMPITSRAVWGHLITSRGCPYPCLFCTQMIRESYGARVRLRNPALVVDEMEYLKAHGANVLVFDDDNLTTDPGYVKALCQEMIRRQMTLPWVAHARADNLTPELLSWMKRAGCALLRLGIESPVPRIIQLLKKGGPASLWGDTVRRAVREARTCGIPTLGLFIIGNPTETESEIFETIRFALEIPLDFVQVHFFTPYVGSGAYTIYKEKIDPSVLTEQYHYHAPQTTLSQVETKRLSELRTRFYRQFYFRPRWIARHLQQYGRFYAANPRVLTKLVTPLWR